MTDTITLTGLVATTPRHLVTGGSLPITSFRLASTQRRFDRDQNRWVDAETNWYTVTAFRQLALNAAGSLQKGDRIVVSGRLRLREWQAGESKGINIEVEADALGHDLAWGTAVWTRTSTVSGGSNAPVEDSSSASAGGWAPRSNASDPGGPEAASAASGGPSAHAPSADAPSTATQGAGGRQGSQVDDDRLAVPF